MTILANNTDNSASTWSSGQVYVMAGICLVMGILVGYLLHNPETSRAATATVAQMQAPAAMPAGLPQQMHSLEQLKQMADKQAEPLLKQLQNNPQDPQLLIQTAYIYKAAHQFKEAASYFDRSLQIDPKNVAIRTEMASCLYYVGQTDDALTQLEKSLKYDSKHAGTLFNLGMIQWKGKGNADAAIAAWEKLLALYPTYERKALVEQLIAEAKHRS